MPSGTQSSLGGSYTQPGRSAPGIPPGILPRRSSVAYFLPRILSSCPVPRVALRSLIPSGDLLYQKAPQKQTAKPVHRIENAKDPNAQVVLYKALRRAMERSGGSTKLGRPWKKVRIPHTLHSVDGSDATASDTPETFPLNPGTSTDTDGLGRKVMSPETENCMK